MFDILKYVSLLVAVAFGFYCMLTTLPFIFLENNSKIRNQGFKAEFEQLKMAKQSCNVQEQLIPCRY